MNVPDSGCLLSLAALSTAAGNSCAGRCSDQLNPIESKLVGLSLPQSAARLSCRSLSEKGPSVLSDGEKVQQIRMNSLNLEETQASLRTQAVDIFDAFSHIENGHAQT